MIKIENITSYLEDFAPLSYQEEYDNSGLIVGDQDQEITGILICLDVTESVVDEAIKSGVNLIISHHPIIFRGLKKLTSRTHVERTVLKAIKNNIALYAIHTNLDNVSCGVNARICERLNIVEQKILAPKQNTLSKLVTFIPAENKDKVLNALYEAGVGEIGKYDHCSFSVDGTGTFRPGEEATPYIGNQGDEESVKESRVEVIFPSFMWNSIHKALNLAHPYEEVAYYLTSLDNENHEAGSGMIGNLSEPMSPDDFLHHLKERMETKSIRYTQPGSGQKIKKVAVCGGSGSFLIPEAIKAGADAFITGDIKYHDFYKADGKLLLADIGHYESEIFTKELLRDLLIKKFNTFALHLSKTDTNPISYF